jgi:MFS family permease
VPTHNSLIGFPSNVYDNKPSAAPVAKGSPTSSPTSPIEEVDEWAVYNRFGHGRKVGIAILMGFCGLISPISSTALLAALPEVANDYGTTGTIISISNALYLFVMGFSPPFWGPMSQVYGRKPIAMSVLCIVMVCSIGTALSPNLGSFFFFRLFTGFAATSLMVLGSAVVGDLFHPTERSTGLSYYMLGPLVSRIQPIESFVI